MPPAPPDPEKLAAWSLVRAYHAVARLFYASLRTVDLTPSQFGVLVEVDRRPSISQADLARAVLATPQTVSEMVAGMIDRGLLDRAGTGRGTPARLNLTPAGAAALADAWPVVHDAVGPASLGLSADDASHLNDLLLAVLRGTGTSDAGSTSD